MQNLMITFEMEMMLEMMMIQLSEMMYEMTLMQLKEMMQNRNHAGDWKTTGIK